MKHEIDQSTCKQCELCITICPSGILSKNDSGAIFFQPAKIDICISCGHCMAVCETKSILVDGLTYEINLPELPVNTVDYGAFHHFLMTRRSVRNFKDKPVPAEFLQKIADVIALAPYGVSPDNVDITIVSDRKMIEKALPPISTMYLQMKKMLVMAPFRWMMRWMVSKEDFNTMLRFILPHLQKGLYDYSKEDDISRNAPAMILFHAPKGAEQHTVDSLIYTTYAFLAAHSLGLGATVIGLIGPGINQNKKLKDLYGIPVENEVIETLILGYPKIQFRRAIVRPRKKITIL